MWWNAPAYQYFTCRLFVSIAASYCPLICDLLLLLQLHVLCRVFPTAAHEIYESILLMRFLPLFFSLLRFSPTILLRLHRGSSQDFPWQTPSLIPNALHLPYNRLPEYQPLQLQSHRSQVLSSSCNSVSWIQSDLSPPPHPVHDRQHHPVPPRSAI